MEENRLDIAVCGSAILDAATGNPLGRRAVTEPLLLTRPEDFSGLFPAYHQFMRTAWGKLFSGRAARHIYTAETTPQKLRGLPYGSDTVMAFSALRHAERVGLSPDVLHRYYISPKSVSYQYNARRFDSDTCLYDDAMDFLAAFGPVSDQNREFLAVVYAFAIADTVRVILAVYESAATGKTVMPDA